ncbi:hypothetical protein LZ30DRAFT_460083 [Colletotrichum cereale]|nr:hypothetical protein LZ30DRAFT_460083 [Colletotrichum cereale]
MLYREKQRDREQTRPLFDDLEMDNKKKSKDARPRRKPESGGGGECLGFCWPFGTAHGTPHSRPRREKRGGFQLSQTFRSVEVDERVHLLAATPPALATRQGAWVRDGISSLLERGGDGSLGIPATSHRHCNLDNRTSHHAKRRPRTESGNSAWAASP